MYVLRRLLRLPISLLLLSLICFGLRQLSPGDPVAAAMATSDFRQDRADLAAYDQRYRRTATRLGLDLPPFYFTLTNAALPDTLHRIARSEERAMVRILAERTGNWPATQRYYRSVKAYVNQGIGEPGGAARGAPAGKRLLSETEPARIDALLTELPGQAEGIRSNYEALLTNQHRSRLLLPRLQWNGPQNQYHRWLVPFLRGDWGTSTVDGLPVYEKIRAALPRTLLLNVLAILLVFLVSLPLGLQLAAYPARPWSRLTNLALFVLYGIPSFWVATLLANFFTTPAYGMDLFPSMGFGEVPSGSGLSTYLMIKASHLFLPVLCLAYPSWAYVTRHLRAAALRELGSAYVTTAKMKGLATWGVLYRHVLRNASFPLVTILGSLFPALLGGSVLIERIFNLPGMGQLLFRSAVSGDWPVIIALVLINGILTVLGLLVADLVYALLDPRVRLHGRARPVTVNR